MSDRILILSVAQGAAVAAVRDMHPAKVAADICNVDSVEHPFDMNKENVLEPIMIHNMKHEKIIPKGGDVVADGEVRTGVHKNTKIYIQDSMIL